MSILRTSKPPAFKASFSFTNLLVIIEFNLRSMLSNKANLMQELLLIPLAYVGLLAAGLSSLSTIVQYEDITISYLTFAYPGILGIQLLKSFSNCIYYITAERRYGLQALKFVAGTGHVGYMIGMMIIPIAVFCIQIIVSFPLAYFLGAKTTYFNFILVLFIGMIAAMFWTSLALLVSFYFKRYATRDMFLSLIILPMTFSSPAFYSIDKAPSYIQWISYFNPLSYQILALREAFILGKVSNLILENILLATIAFLLSILFLKNLEYLPTET